VDEKRQHMEDEVSSSRVPKSWNGGKTKVLVVKLTLDIEQQIDLQNVFEEKILDNWRSIGWECLVGDTITYALC
jgi:hypothetical protein